MSGAGQSAKGGGSNSQATQSSTTERSTSEASSRPGEDAARYAMRSSVSSPTNHVQLVWSRSSDLSAVRKVIVNELLAYVNCYRHSTNAEALQKVVLSHFATADITEAKRIVTDEFQSVSGAAQYVTKRHNSATRSAHEAELEDILSILDICDIKEALDSYIFIAANFKIMPKFSPEEIKLGVVVDRQVKMEYALANLTTCVEQIASAGPAKGEIMTAASCQHRCQRPTTAAHRLQQFPHG